MIFQLEQIQLDKKAGALGFETIRSAGSEARVQQVADGTGRTWLEQSVLE